MGGMGGGGGGAGGRGAGRQAAPVAAALPVGPVVIPEAERVKKIRDFIALYGPITIAHEKDRDGRILEWAVFSYKSQSFKMPLSMILDAPKPQQLERYFRIYPNIGGFNKGTAQWKITATSAIPPPPVQPGAKPPAAAPAAPAKPGAAAAAPAPRAGGPQRPAAAGGPRQAAPRARAGQPAAGSQQTGGGAPAGRRMRGTKRG
jgi:hypothetical protein